MPKVSHKILEENAPEDCAQFLRDCGIPESLILECMARAMLVKIQSTVEKIGIPEGEEKLFADINDILEQTAPVTGKNPISPF